MKLSIQNIVDWFVEHQYLIHSEIREPEPCLLNVNWLSDQKLRPETVYVEQYSAAADTQLNTTIVTLHNDIIRVDGCEPGEAFNILLSIFEWFNNWERRLLFCILAQQSIQQMCDIGDEVFQAPTIICGNDGQTFAITTHYSAKISPVWRARLEDDSLSFDLIQKEGGKKYLSSLQRQSYPSLNDSPIWGGPTLNANLFYRGKRKGFIVAYQYRKSFRPGDVHLMNVFARLVERYLTLNPSQYFSLSYLEHFLYRLLIGDQADFSKLDIIFRYNGWKKQDQYYMLCTVSSDKLHIFYGDMEKLQAELKNMYNGLCSFIFHEVFIVLVNQTIYRGADETLIGSLRTGLDGQFTICRSLDFYDIRSFSDYYEKTFEIARHALERQQPVVRVQDEIQGEVRDYLRGNKLALSLVHPAVEQLDRYDSENKSSLVDTLKIYLLCGCNSTDTANRLSVHRNTLIKRVQKIQRITGLDLTDSRVLRYLLLSILIYKA